MAGLVFGEIEETVCPPVRCVNHLFRRLLLRDNCIFCSW